MKKIVELLIDWDNLEFDDLGVDVMSIVDSPAIGIDFLAFSEVNDDMIDGIVDLLNQVEDIDNRIAMAKESIDSFVRDEIEYDKEDFLRRIGLHEMPNGDIMAGAEHGFVEPNSGETEDEYVSRCIPVLKGEGYDDDQATAICYNSFDPTEAIQDAILKLAKEYGETVDYENAVFVDGTKSNFENVGDYLKGIVGLDILGKQDADKEPETKYRYTGPISSNSRSFCKAMVRLNKLYTRDEIREMDRSINTGFRHRGQAYSIFDFKGGIFCNHFWSEVEVYKEGRQTVVMSKGRASGRAGQVASSSNEYWRYPGTFAFSDDEQMIITGPAMVPDQLILRKDEKGVPFHVFFSKDTVKKIAQKFFEYNNQNNTDINHDDDITTNNTLLESWIVDDPDMDKSKAMGFEVPEGTWMASYKINNEETWNQIKAGELNGFSVAGQFIEKATKA
tara:strand:- start:7062 stop:8402 length:1341 start_codon:yes stop_codon:yes gene_type:complete